MKRCISLFILVALLIYLVPSQAFAARKVLSVPQELGEINCGACCASMNTMYFKGDNISREQIAWDHRVSYNNNCWLHSGSSNWYNCTGYYSVKALAGQSGGGYSHTTNLNYDFYKGKIDAGSPVTLGLVNYLGSGHAISGKGYDTGSSGTENWIIYNDPYDGLGHSATHTWIESNWNISGYAYWK